MNKLALGRGLGSLIPSKSTIGIERVMPPEAGRVVLDIPLAKIRANPRQPRKDFGAGDLEDLIQSIKEHGLIQPLIVTKQGDFFELIAGERRLRAARALGFSTVPAIVREANEQQKLELAIIENIQRADLNPYEEALAYRALIDEFSLTQEMVATRIGKSRSAVANILRLLDLPDEMLRALREGKITKSHARTLLGEVDQAKRRQLFLHMLEGGITVREAEETVYAPRARLSKDPNLAAHEKRLREALGTKVNIHRTGNRGRIVIEFYSDEELLNLLHQLTQEK